MRLLYTTIFFCLFTGLSAQLFEASKAEHGGSPATARPAIELAVQSPDGDFVAVVVRDDQAANTQNIVLYRIEASDATVIDSSDVAAAGVQFPLDVIRTADGHYWVLGIETVFGEDNATDILLLEFSAELDPLTSFDLIATAMTKHLNWLNPPQVPSLC